MKEGEYHDRAGRSLGVGDRVRFLTGYGRPRTGVVLAGVLHTGTVLVQGEDLVYRVFSADLTRETR